jgi:Protein of unknown function (DUF2505)
VRFELVQRFPLPLPGVEAAYVDPGFLGYLGQLPNVGQPELLEQRDHGGQLWQRVHYAFTGELSPAVKAVVDPRYLTWVEESTLNRADHRTTFVIRPDRYAGLLDASGQVTLTPDGSAGDATIRRVSGDVSVHVPFVGRKVETVIVSGLREHAAEEVGALERWAAGQA